MKTAVDFRAYKYLTFRRDSKALREVVKQTRAHHGHPAADRPCSENAGKRMT